MIQNNEDYSVSFRPHFIHCTSLFCIIPSTFYSLYFIVLYHSVHILFTVLHCSVSFRPYFIHCTSLFCIIPSIFYSLYFIVLYHSVHILFTVGLTWNPVILILSQWKFEASILWFSVCRPLVVNWSWSFTVNLRDIDARMYRTKFVQTPCSCSCEEGAVKFW